MEDKFNFFIPVGFEKAEGDDPEKKYDNMIVWGEASDNSEDSDEEILEPSGYDIKDFLKKGLVNLEHYTTRKGSSKYWIGEPIEAKVKGDKFFVKAKLWSKHPEARNFYDTCMIMQESGSTRKPGWSIEGRALQRDPSNPKRILKAKINNIALTFTPKNKNSWADIVKGGQEEDYIEPVNELVDELYLYEFEKGGETYRVNTDFSIEKAMTAGTETGTQLIGKVTSGASLKKESLEDDLKVIVPQFKIISEKFKKGEISKEKYEKIKKSIEEFVKNR